MPGQRSIHFVKEAESRRRKLIKEITDLGFSGIRFEAKEKNQKLARELCIKEIVRFADKNEIRNLAFERDESAVANDEKWLKEEIRETQGIDRLGFVHLNRFEEPLLWVADAIAWCDARGGDWEKRINSSIKFRIEASA